MSIYVSPIRAHGPTEPRPPGITGGLWCYMISSVDLADLTAMAITAGALEASIRTPAAGASVTYIALLPAQRTAALAAGALPAPTEGLARAQSLDGPASSWEPA